MHELMLPRMLGKGRTGTQEAAIAAGPPHKLLRCSLGHGMGLQEVQMPLGVR